MRGELFKDIMFVIVLIWAFLIIPISYLIDKGGAVSGILLVVGFIVICPLGAFAMNKYDERVR